MSCNKYHEKVLTQRGWRNRETGLFFPQRLKGLFELRADQTFFTVYTSQIQSKHWSQKGLYEVQTNFQGVSFGLDYVF